MQISSHRSYYPVCIRIIREYAELCTIARLNTAAWAEFKAFCEVESSPVSLALKAPEGGDQVSTSTFN